MRGQALVEKNVAGVAHNVRLSAAKAAREPANCAAGVLGISRTVSATAAGRRYQTPVWFRTLARRLEGSACRHRAVVLSLRDRGRLTWHWRRTSLGPRMPSRNCSTYVDRGSWPSWSTNGSTPTEMCRQSPVSARVSVAVMAICFSDQRIRARGSFRQCLYISAPFCQGKFQPLALWARRRPLSCGRFSMAS